MGGAERAVRFSPSSAIGERNVRTVPAVAWAWSTIAHGEAAATSGTVRIGPPGTRARSNSAIHSATVRVANSACSWGTSSARCATRPALVA